MAHLDPQRRVIVDGLLARFDALSTSEAPTRPMFVLLRATPGVGKTRLVQELYEALRVRQSPPPFWPSLFRHDIDNSVLAERHLIGPRPTTHFSDHDPLATMEYLWWGIHCEDTSRDPLSGAVEELSYLAPALLEAEVRRGRKIMDASGELIDSMSSALGIVGFAGLAAPAAAALVVPLALPTTIVGGAAAVGFLARKIDSWREKKRQSSVQSQIHESANDTSKIELLAANLAQLSQDLPSVLIVNDAHYASPRVIELLEHLRQRQTRLLVVLTAWPVDAEDQPLLNWWRSDVGDEIHLDPLALSTLQALFDEALPGVVPAVRDALIAKMDHNPLTLRLALRESARGFRAHVLAARTPTDITMPIPRDPREAFTLFWSELPDDVQTALALASHLGPEYFDAIVVDAATNHGPLIDGLWDGPVTTAGLDGGERTGVVRRSVDATLHRFIEKTFYDLAATAARDEGRISDADTRAVRQQLQEFLRDEHPDLSDRVLGVLRTRLLELALECDDVEAELALDGAVTTAFQLLSAGDYTEALRVSDLATRLSARVRLDESEVGLRIRAARSSALSSLGRYQEALTLQESVLATLCSQFPDDHPDVLSAMHNLAATYWSLGHHEEALAIQESVLATYRSQFPDDHPDVVRAMHNLAATYMSLGHHEEALALKESVLATLRTQFPDDHPDVVRAMHNLATTYSQDSHYTKEALNLQESVLATYRSQFPDDHRYVVWAMHNLARTYFWSGRKEALTLQESVLATLRTQFPDDHPDVLSAMHNLALIYSSKGRHQDALELRESVLATYRSQFPDDHPDVVRAMHNLAATYMSLGHHEEALALKESVLATYVAQFPVAKSFLHAFFNHIPYAYRRE